MNFDKEKYVQDFILELDKHIPAVVFSSTHLENIERRIREGKTKESPIEQARAFLKKIANKDDVERYGEFGEILLSIFAVRVKGAFKLVSKIQNREKIKRNVLGRDGIYAYKDSDNNVYFLAGEAKTLNDSNDALREAHADLKKFWESKDDVEHEISLASSHIADEISKENLAVYEDYFINDNQKRQELKYKKIIIILLYLFSINY